MTCKELVELVTEYLEDALGIEDRKRFETHLAECPGCQTYLDQMRQTIRALGQLREEDMPSEARDKLLHTFRNWSR